MSTNEIMALLEGRRTYRRFDESRQIPDREFEYRFYFDIEASVYSEEFLSLMCELHECGEQFKYFGTYAEII